MIHINKAELEFVCGVKSSFPATSLPEYAFAGRSNVGKSTLINALMQRKSLARTSSTPGKTQTINYYRVNDKLYFVDLPGYGYTKAAESARAAWGRTVEKYLSKSGMIKMIFLLVDIRHKPTGDDLMMYDWIREASFDPVIIATKADKLNKSEKTKALKVIGKAFDLSGGDRLMEFSALSMSGRDEIYKILEEL